MVFVIDKNNNPLSPTSKAKARLLLKHNKAFVVKFYPFVIKLKKSIKNISNKNFIIKLDPGASTTGIAIVDSNKCLFLMELIHRGKEIKKALLQRKAIRNSRRQRKTRYRKCRFLNRRRKVGWLAPSIKSRADNIINLVKKLSKYLNIKKVVIESVSFDTNSMLNGSKVYGLDNQNGPLKDTKLRNYMLNKFNNSCVYCGSSDKLEVEHLISKINGGTNSINNLTLSCRKCNELKNNLSLKAFGKLINKDLSKLETKKTPKEASIIQSARNYTIKELNKSYEIEIGEGWETSYNRKEINLPKEHYYDALCVGKEYNYKIITKEVLEIKANGRGTRQMCRVDKYGFPRTSAKENKVVNGFQTGDIVKAKVLKGKKIGKYFGKVAVRSKGYFNITTKSGVIQGIGYKDCILVQKNDGYSYNIKGVNRFLTSINVGISSV